MISIILLSGFGIISLFAGFLKSKRILLPMALLFLVVVFGVNLFDWDQNQSYFSNMLTIDNFAVAFTGIMVLSTLLILPFTQHYITRNDENVGELYALILFSLVGAIMMVSYNNMLMLFIGIEILSIAMYVFAGSDKGSMRSAEAALKYFLMGSFFTGILLFGIVMIYGATGTFNIAEIAGSAEAMGTAGVNNIMFMLGVLMIIIGISFKVSAAPFHFWTPDVYEGTPTVWTAYMSTVVKTAGVAAFYKLMDSAFAASYGSWMPTLVAIIVLTLLIGNVGAVVQQSMKRMLAYSSISHAGYLLMTLLAFNEFSQSAILFYSFAYSTASIAAFGVLQLVARQRQSENYEAFNGLGKTNPLLAFAVSVSMLSLAGIPMTAGFFGKFFVFSALVEQPNMMWMIVVAVILAAVGVYYYFRVIITMYLHPVAEGHSPIKSTSFINIMLIIISVLTILLGIAPALLSDVL
ncbi:NADH-quinone oxidoreductase subunit N [Pontibacter sp. JH31]|uniref:NADH-quinone oxidoreductase subunit N n=1 Tax=Pontibacter aquaedesilientis TaxID=2766980 RepID=A0ABR7XF94_9BACT|nr:NADH-quinone oxidoreductase subunit N [Pontibacter aquaedesilientis]MBD1396586.1 NADH-quinone oxidoreductase subunit N [Pontibacter aquaedesilientis]